MSKSFPGVPKALIPVAGVPMLEHILGECREHNIKNVLISVFHQKEQIVEFVQDGSKFGLNVEYVVEATPVGTGGALFLAQEFLADNFFVLYGDVFSTLNLGNLKRHHLQNLSDITCVVHPNDHPFDSDLVETDDKGRIIRLLPKDLERRKSYKNQAAAAMYCMSKHIFQVEVDLPKFDIAADLVPICINKGMKVNAFQTVEYIKDMGSPDRHRNVSSAIEKNLHISRSSKIKRVAVIFDRDGTINVENGHIANPDELKLVNGASDAIRAINCSKFLALCATNQPVVARGEVTPDGLREIHKKLDTQLGQHGAFLDDLIYCPHHPESGFGGEVKDLKIACNCRKPKSGMIEMYVEKYGLNRRKSLMVGDRFSDIKAADAGGVNSILLLSGSLDKQIEFVCRPTYLASSLPNAIDWILSCFDDLFKMSIDIYNTGSYSNAALLLRGESQSNCLSVARMLQQHFLPNSIIYDFFGELKVNQGCKNTTVNKIKNISKNFLFSHKIEYSEIMSCDAQEELWLLPPSKLNHGGSIIIPIGSHGKIDGLETMMPTYLFEIPRVTVKTRYNLKQ